MVIEDDELINYKDLQIHVKIGERDAVGPQEVVFVQKNEEAKACKALEDVESINCANFEILTKAGNDEKVAVGPHKVTSIQDLSKGAKNSYEEEMALQKKRYT